MNKIHRSVSLFIMAKISLGIADISFIELVAQGDRRRTADLLLGRDNVLVQNAQCRYQFEDRTRGGSSEEIALFTKGLASSMLSCS